MKRTNASLLFFLACLASCVPAPSLPPQVRETVELPASEDPASWDRKGAEELAKALRQTGLPLPWRFGRVVVMTATQNRAMDAGAAAMPSLYGVMMTGGGGFSADDAAAETVTAELLRRGYRVVERQALNAVLREQGFQQSGMVDQATAVRLGKLAGAEAIVIANVYNNSKEYHLAAGKVLDPSGMVYQLDVTVKMIDAQTAEVLWWEDKSFQSSPGEKTSHTQLLRDAVASLSFPTPRSDVAAPAAAAKRRRSAEIETKPADPEVKQAQGILKELGYDPGPIDGLLGKKAREALRQFQRDHHLPETGQIDAATKAVLQQPATKAAGQSEHPPASASPSEAVY